MELGLEERIVKILIKSLKTYNEQVLRNGLEAGIEGIGANLFISYQDEKRGMIEYQLASIADYLLSSKNEFIFGFF